MDGVNNKIREAIKPHGYKTKTVSITHLPEAQEAVGRLVREGLVDRRLSENWHFYLDTNKDLPDAKTIIITALPQPVTRLTFSWQGETYCADVPPTYLTRADETRFEATLHDVLESAGYKISKAHLALKTLAVRSGLARYGKNNLAYVPGLGSFCRLIAFYSDVPCEEDNWQASGAMKTCENCTLCRESCANGSITADRFLIHAEKCLTRYNETESDLPAWIQPDWHHTLIGCLHCQAACPVNKPYLQKIAVGPTFFEEETQLILNKTSVEMLANETRQKLDSLIYEGIYLLMARNLRALIEKQRQAG